MENSCRTANFNLILNINFMILGRALCVRQKCRVFQSYAWLNFSKPAHPKHCNTRIDCFMKLLFCGAVIDAFFSIFATVTAYYIM